jgi:hypothetical protein
MNLRKDMSQSVTSVQTLAPDATQDKHDKDGTIDTKEDSGFSSGDSGNATAKANRNNSPTTKSANYIVSYKNTQAGSNNNLTLNSRISRKVRTQSAESMQSVVPDSASISKSSPLKLKRQLSALSLSLSRQKSQPTLDTPTEHVSEESEFDSMSYSSDASLSDMFACRGVNNRETVVQIGFDALSKSRGSFVCSPVSEGLMSSLRTSNSSPALASPVRLYPRALGSVLNLACPHNALYEERERKANDALLLKRQERRAREAGIVMLEEPVKELPLIPMQQVCEPTAVDLESPMESSQELTVTEDKPPLMKSTPSLEWVSDALRPACVLCGLLFNFIRRRHHCRLCLEVFCNNCSSKTVNQKRACLPCYETQSAAIVISEV